MSVRMSVPCCSSLEKMAKSRSESGRELVHVIERNGHEENHVSLIRLYQDLSYAVF